MFVFSLIMNRSEVLPSPKLLLEELPSHFVISLSERIFFFKQLSCLQLLHAFLIQYDSKEHRYDMYFLLVTKVQKHSKHVGLNVHSKLTGHKALKCSREKIMLRSMKS